MAIFVLLGLSSRFMEIRWDLLTVPVVLWLIAVTYGVFQIKMNLFLKCKNRLKSSHAAVALTFDDGPSQYTDEILDILKNNGIKATFFLVGKNLKGNENKVIRMAKEGHAVGNHTYTHSVFFPLKSKKKMGQEIIETNKVIEELTAQKPLLFRPPFGVTNPVVAAAVRSARMECAGWSLRSLDTVISNENRLLKRLKKKTRNGSVVLLHENRKSTVQVLEQYILFLKDKGFKTETLNANRGE